MNTNMKTIKLIEQAVYFLECEEFNKSAFNNLSLTDYLLEYRTVGLYLPRQCGKTEWVGRRVSNNDKSLVVFSRKRYCVDLFVKRFPSVNKLTQTASINQKIIPERYYGTVIFDDSRYMDIKKIHKFIDKLNVDKDTKIILL